MLAATGCALEPPRVTSPPDGMLHVMVEANGAPGQVSISVRDASGPHGCSRLREAALRLRLRAGPMACMRVDGSQQPLVCKLGQPLAAVDIVGLDRWLHTTPVAVATEVHSHPWLVMTCVGDTGFGSWLCSALTLHAM